MTSELLTAQHVRTAPAEIKLQQLKQGEKQTDSTHTTNSIHTHINTHTHTREVDVYVPCEESLRRKFQLALIHRWGRGAIGLWMGGGDLTIVQFKNKPTSTQFPHFLLLSPIHVNNKKAQRIACLRTRNK